MSDEAKADIAVQLIALATYAESANHWTDEERLMGAAGVADTIYDAIDRIEELEAKLAKAVAPLPLPRPDSASTWKLDPKFVMDVAHAIQREEGWDASMEAVELAMLAAEKHILQAETRRATLAELKGTDQ